MMIIVLISVQTKIQAQTNGEGDWQYWNNTSIEGTLSPKARVELEQDFRFGDDFSNFYREHTQILFGYKIFDWLEVAPAYHQAFDEKDGEFHPEQRPQIDLTGKWTIHGWEVIERNRLEYRDKFEKENTIRYRNQLKLKFPISWTQWKIRPYIAEEPFFESEGAGFNSNRASVGLEVKLAEHVKTDLYFLWRTTDSGEEWIDNYIFGSKLKLSF